MSDRNKNATSDFDRELAAISRAYKNAEQDTPSSAMDDAIRAAARRGVKSKPHVIGKSWIARWSTPLSAAALVVLSVSVGLVAIDEQPALAPAELKEMVQPKPPSAAAPAVALEPAGSVAPAETPRASRPASAMDKKARMESQDAAARDRIMESSKPDLERRGNEASGAASGTVLSKDIGSTVAVNSPAPAAPLTPAPVLVAPAKSLAKESDAFVSDPPRADVAAQKSNVGVIETAKREVAQEKLAAAPAPGAIASAKRDVSLATAQRAQALTHSPLVSATGATAPPVYAAPTAAAPPLADKAYDAPEVWIKRILELKRQGKTREFDAEFAKFRKRYADFVLPDELKPPK